MRSTCATMEAMHTITLYAKPDCPLCDKAEAQLRALVDRTDVALKIVDITQDDALYARYWAQIPVVAFADGTTLYAPIDEAELRQVLKRRMGNYQR